MKITAIFFLGVLSVAAVDASAQPDQDILRILSRQLRPRWIETVSRPDAPAADSALASLDELKLPQKIQRPAMVLLFSNKDQVTQAAYENLLFRHPRIVLTAKAFVCIRVDLRRDERLNRAYGNAVPRILLFDRQGGRRADISMAGFRQRPDMLGSMMRGVMDGYGTMPLERFVAAYRALLPDLVPIETASRRIEARRAEIARASGAAATEERARLDAERRKLAAARKAWTAREQALLRKYHGDA